MTLTEEQYRVVGDPSELWVQEAVFYAMKRTRPTECLCRPIDPVTVETVVGVLMRAEPILVDEAMDRVFVAIRRGEVGHFVNTVYDDRPLMLTLDLFTFLRLERRAWFWSHTDETIAARNGLECRTIPAHLPNECAVVRAAIWEWLDTFDEAPQIEGLVGMVLHLSDYQERGEAIHAILNALDAGAVFPDGDDFYFAIQEGWIER